MIMKDAVTSYLITLSKFCAKKGTDANTNRELIQAINTLTEDPMLGTIYVNNRDNINIPDVCVMHLFDKGFSKYILDPDTPMLCPFGYTIEIHSRCFSKYTDEELGAIIIHDVLQNVMTDTAKIRFMKAYTDVLNKYSTEHILKVFDRINLDEVLYIAFSEICIRPFRVPANVDGYVSTDDVLRAMGLADAYDSYLQKALPMSNNTPESVMSRELVDDVRDLNTIIRSCMDDDIRHYYAVVRKGIPLLSFENILGNPHGNAAMGFIPRGMKIAWKRPEPKCDTLTESYNDPKDEYEIRYQIDKIVGNMRYAESEAEREVVLFKIKQLSIKLARLEQKLSRIQSPSPAVTERLVFIQSCKSELDDLRKKVVTMEIKEKRWHVYSKGECPPGYDF